MVAAGAEHNDISAPGDLIFWRRRRQQKDWMGLPPPPSACVDPHCLPLPLRGQATAGTLRHALIPGVLGALAGGSPCAMQSDSPLDDAMALMDVLLISPVDGEQADPTAYLQSFLADTLRDNHEMQAGAGALYISLVCFGRGGVERRR
eukprot:gene9185-biopygen18187